MPLHLPWAPSTEETTGDSRAARQSVPYALAFLAFTAYAALSVSTYERFADRSWDLAIFTQAVRAYAHGHAPIASIKGPGFDLLGDHFSPIIACVAPIYRVFPTPLTLQVAQAALLALAVVPITRLAIRELGLGAGAAIGAAYVLAWGVQSAVAVDFHEVAFAVPLLAFALEAYSRGDWSRTACWAAPLTLVKEDLGVTAAAIGILMMTRGARKSGAVLAVGTSAASALAVLVVIPALNSRHTYPYWSMVASGRSHFLSSALRAPANLLFPQPKFHTVCLLIAMTGLIALRSPISLITLPTLLWRFLSSNSSYWTTDWHYSAVLMPILFVATVEGIRLARGSRRNWIRSHAVHTPAIVVTVAVMLCPSYPLHALWDSRTYAPSSRAAAAHTAISLIAPGATVETDSGLMAQLAARRTVYWIGGTRGVTPRYVVIDAFAGWSPSAPTNAARYAEGLHPGHTYRLLYDNDGYEVAINTNISSTR